MLPNLPELSRFATTRFFAAPVSLLDWVLVLPPDPTRWLVSFSSGETGSILVSPEPDGAVQAGVLLNPGNLLEFKYKDYLTLVQGSWYAHDIGGNGPLWIYEACIALTPGPITNPKESEA